MSKGTEYNNMTEETMDADESLIEDEETDTSQQPAATGEGEDPMKRFDYDFEDDEWDGISRGAKSLIDSLLNTDPAKRASVDDAIAHRWFR